MFGTTQRVVLGLVSSFVIMAVAQMSRSAEALLLCSDLRGCSGSSGCWEYGAKSKCVLTCSDNSKVYCNTGGS
jgi:hypothetical protein